MLLPVAEEILRRGFRLQVAAQSGECQSAAEESPVKIVGFVLIGRERGQLDGTLHLGSHEEVEAYAAEEQVGEPVAGLDVGAELEGGLHESRQRQLGRAGVDGIFVGSLSPVVARHVVLSREDAVAVEHEVLRDAEAHLGEAHLGSQLTASPDDELRYGQRLEDGTLYGELQGFEELGDAVYRSLEALRCLHGERGCDVEVGGQLELHEHSAPRAVVCHAHADLHLHIGTEVYVHTFLGFPRAGNGGLEVEEVLLEVVLVALARPAAWRSVGMAACYAAAQVALWVGVDTLRGDELVEHVAIAVQGAVLQTDLFASVGLQVVVFVDLRQLAAEACLSVIGRLDAGEGVAYLQVEIPPFKAFRQMEIDPGSSVQFDVFGQYA